MHAEPSLSGFPSRPAPQVGTLSRGAKWCLSPLRVAAIAAVTVWLSAAVQAQGITESIVEFDRLPQARTDYPPPNDPNILFYVQRSANSNTVVYAARLSGAGRLDRDEPVQVFWRRFNSDGGRKSLSFAERNMAFGVEARTAPGREGAAIVNIVSYPTRKALVELDEKGRPRAVIDMGNRRAKLAYAYIQLAEDSGTIPSIAYVDLYGVDLATGRALRERIRPSKSAGR
jgi:hypothetical protein